MEATQLFGRVFGGVGPFFSFSETIISLLQLENYPRTRYLGLSMTQLALMFISVYSTIQLISLCIIILRNLFSRNQSLWKAKSKKYSRDHFKHKSLNAEFSAILNAVSESTMNRILRASTGELRDLMAKEVVSCTTVMVVFISRAKSIGREYSAVTEECFDLALNAARILDKVRRSGKVNGEVSPWLDTVRFPLLGVPICVSDAVNIKGFDSSCGKSVHCFVASEQDAVLLRVLRDSGAIPFMKSNLQSVMGTENDAWGKCLDPWQLGYGQLSGDGTIISLAVAPVCIGLDVPMRVSAASCGCVAFQPTGLRVSHSGVRPMSNPIAQQLVPLTLGVTAKRVEDALRVFAALCSSRVNDMNVPPLPFTPPPTSSTKPRRVGVLSSDEWFEPAGAAKRAVSEAAHSLSLAGHDIVLLSDQMKRQSLLCGRELCQLYYALLSGNDLEASEGISSLLWGITRINSLRSFVGRFLRARGDVRLATLMDSSDITFEEATCRLKAFREAWTALFADNKLDAVLLPATALPAMDHKAGPSCSMSYAFLAQLLQWPAGVLPVTHVMEHEAGYHSAVSLPPLQRDSLSRAAHSSMSGTADLPVAVQVMTPAFTDELCLDIMRSIEKHAISAK